MRLHSLTGNEPTGLMPVKYRKGASYRVILPPDYPHRKWEGMSNCQVHYQQQLERGHTSPHLPLFNANVCLFIKPLAGEVVPPFSLLLFRSRQRLFPQKEHSKGESGL
jgi:hypothetical protein